MIIDKRETDDSQRGNYEIRKCHDMFGGEYYALFATNVAIGITMEILPVALTEENGFNWQRNRLTVQFLDLSNSLLHAEEDYLSEKDVPNLNAKDIDVFEELLSRYAQTFSKVTKYKDYKDLIAQIFPDIEEARKER